MAEVFLARLPGVSGFQKTLVIKRILPNLASRKHYMELFVAEASLAAEVRHRNAVQVFELGEVDGELYMAMEYVEGYDVRRLLRYAQRLGLRIPPWFSVYVVCEVLEALDYAFALRDEQGRPRKVVHRDVSPSNIFVSRQGEVKLGDFGVAKDDTRAQETRAGQLKGKVAYMAPEQLHGRPVDQRTDLFASGVVLWECLTQRRLFGGRPDLEAMNAICVGQRARPSEYVADVPSALDAVVLKALQPEPEDRFATAIELQHALFEVLEGMRPRVTPSEVRRVQAGLTSETSPAEAGLELLAAQRQAFRDSAPSFTGLSAGAESRDSMGNGSGFGGFSAAEAELNLDALFTTQDVPTADPYEDLALDLQDLQPPPPRQATPAPWPGLTSQSGLHPVEPPPRAPSGIVAGRPLVPPPRAPSGPGRVNSPPAGVPLIQGQPAGAPPVVRGAPMPRQLDGDPSAGPFDMDALVMDAVQGAQREAPRAPPIEQSSLIAGLDSRRLVGETRASRSERWAFVLDRELYDGPHPFYVVDHEGSEIGPCSYEQALKIIKLEAKAGHAERARVGVQPGNYIPARMMLELLGMSTLVRPELPELPAVLDGDGRTPIRLFAEYTRRPITGRLVLLRDRASRSDYREIEVLGGEPTYVWTEEESLQYPTMLVAKKILRAQAIEELAYMTVAARRPLALIVSKRLGTDLSRYEPMIHKERLVDVFTRGFAAYSVLERTPPVHRESFAPNLLQVALELTFRAVPRMVVETHVGARLRRKLVVARDFERQLSELVLTPEIEQAVGHLTKGKTIERLLETYPEQRRTLTTLAFFCLEAELISIEL
ncbi:MAG: protein kinase [Myxococcales bacterium]|nr:protein kinase [Myxococcales bacterium]